MAIGAYIWGPVMDKFGRKTAYLICMTWFTIFTVCSGFATGVATLLVFRFLAGIGLAGAWVLGNTYVSEFFETEWRAKASGLLQTSGAFGYGLIVLTNIFVVPNLMPDYQWRALYWVGGLCILNVVYLYFFVPESPVWIKARLAQKELSATGKVAADTSVKKMSGWDIFTPKYLRTTLFTALLAASCLLAYWGAGNFIPTFLRTEKGFTAATMNNYLLILFGGAIVGYQIFGYFGDKIGRRWTMGIGAILQQSYA